MLIQRLLRLWQSIWPSIRQPLQSLPAMDPLQRIDLFARMMDTSIAIPGSKLRLGWDPILSFIPFLGSFVGFLLGTYVLLEAWLARASSWVLLRMLGNYLLDAFVGAIPFVGPFLDMWSKAHVRNARMLREHLMKRQFRPTRIA